MPLTANIGISEGARQGPLFTDGDDVIQMSLPMMHGGSESQSQHFLTFLDLKLEIRGKNDVYRHASVGWHAK